MKLVLLRLNTRMRLLLICLMGQCRRQLDLLLPPLLLLLLDLQLHLEAYLLLLELHLLYLRLLILLEQQVVQIGLVVMLIIIDLMYLRVHVLRLLMRRRIHLRSGKRQRRCRRPHSRRSRDMTIGCSHRKSGRIRICHWRRRSTVGLILTIGCLKIRRLCRLCLRMPEICKSLLGRTSASTILLLPRHIFTDLPVGGTLWPPARRSAPVSSQ